MRRSFLYGLATVLLLSGISAASSLIWAVHTKADEVEIFSMEGTAFIGIPVGFLSIRWARRSRKSKGVGTLPFFLSGLCLGFLGLFLIATIAILTTH